MDFIRQKLLYYLNGMIIQYVVMHAYENYFTEPRYVSSMFLSHLLDCSTIIMVVVEHCIN